MEKFTASNGVNVEIGEGSVYTTMKDGSYNEVDHTQALREFFQYERDTELGRWRWPEDPQFVVYGNGDYCTVLNEKDADFNQFSRAQTASMVGLGYRSAARAYFAAHPLPKPWHAAQPGEAWVITYGGEEYAVISDGAYFLWQAGSEQAITDSLITDAHRIWPEVPSE